MPTGWHDTPAARPTRAAGVTPRIAAVAALVALGVAGVAGCSRTTAGSGHVAAAVATGAAPSSSGANPGFSVHPVPSQPVRTATVHAGSASYRIDVWAETTEPTCTGHAYGAPVLDYLQAHPCDRLARLLATTTVHGRAVGFSQVTVSFAGTAPAVYATAGNFRSLVTADGTGSVNDLLREGWRLPTGPTRVPASEAFNALGQHASVTIYDAWYLDGRTPTNAPALVRMTQQIFQQF